ncbi:MAG: hypothetical protein ACREVJ_10305, partial [Gammaproteobacteria bacterium]
AAPALHRSCAPSLRTGRLAVIGAGKRRSTVGLSPPIARRLHHSRDLGEPFDFITWFDYAPEHERDFDALLAELRAGEEWTYVEREIDIRLVQVD